MAIAPRGFAEDVDEDKDLNGAPAPDDVLTQSLRQLKESGNDYYGLVPTHKRNDPDIVDVIKQLKVIDPQIEERMKVAEGLWKARYPSNTSDVDIDELLKEFQEHSSKGESVEPTLRRLDELGHLNKKRYNLILRLRKTSDKNDHIDVRPPQNVSNGLDVRQIPLPEERSFTSVFVENTTGRRFHVVIVGINEYDDQSTPSLKGSVNDALLFRDYVLHDLSVPAEQITTLISSTGDGILPDIPLPLRPQSPTRKNILNALCDLHDNPNIKPDDSIIIFYAGHGQSYSAKDAGKDAGKDVGNECTPLNTGSIEAISPVDRNTGENFRVPDISDREINVILGEIAKKCPNITLILDCCHAGGATRGASDSLSFGDMENLTPRSCPPILSVTDMLKAADAESRLSPDRPRTADPNFRANMKSHVLIAAAKDYEQAHEFTDKNTRVTQGFFTSRLLSALRSPLGRSPTTTYLDLIRRW
ncbi:caspase domain-containing protein [Rhodocollybia butyracea]|uniref:Caspase domain-containing protein n=1 Tax=Rhodocollybia butyracea TaxID=206335 RepID=A0A9P5U5W7_9AGAR|nr:caspase domain-containing protein [Rhodocollybia butyracea]